MVSYVSMVLNSSAFFLQVLPLWSHHHYVDSLPCELLFGLYLFVFAQKTRQLSLTRMGNFQVFHERTRCRLAVAGLMVVYHGNGRLIIIIYKIFAYVNRYLCILYIKYSSSVLNNNKFKFSYP